MREDHLREDDRGVSEVVGTVLLVGLVFAGAMLTLVVGTQALNEATGQQQAAAAEASLEQVDRTLTSLAGASGPNRTRIDLSSDSQNEIKLARAGQINLSVNQDLSCDTTIPLSSLRFEQDGQTTAFEGGGVWKAARQNGSAMVSPPNFAFRNGTLDMTVLNLTGTVDQDTNVVEYSEEESLRRSNEIGVELLSAPCQDPDNITVSVQSDFYHAWGEYFRSDFAVGTVDVFHTNDTARLFISDGDFPTRLDNDRNRVINLSDGSTATYMNDVTLGSDSITANKTDVNGADPGPGPFPATLTPLDRSDRPDIGAVQTLTPNNSTQVSRPPVDVVFVMDESGSMSGSKISDARDAAKNAVGVLNTSVVGDRAGLVGYTSYPRYLLVDGKYLSSQSGKLNSTISSYSAGGGTDLAGGLNHSIAQLDVARDERNTGNIFLLTDGQNSPSNTRCQEYGFSFNNANCQEHFNDRTLNAAHIAEKRGYTVFTFGFGAGANDTLLKEVANVTGGEYFKSASGTELKQDFKNATQQVTTAQEYVTRTPMSTNTSTGSGQVVVPEIPGDVDGIATHNQSGHTFLNVNDPTAPALFSHAFAVDNGEAVQFNATVFECGEWESTGSLAERNGSTYPVARCGNITATNRSLDASNVTLHTNWHNSSATDLQKTDDVNETLEPFVDANGTFVLGSNQAVVRFDFEPHDGGGTTRVENDMFMLYQVGLGESSVDTGELIDIDIGQIEVGS